MMNTKVAIKNLKKIQKKGYTFFYKGHIKYLKENVLASIEFLQNTKSKEDKLLVSDAYLEVGQLYELIHSLPTIAITYYKKALIYNPANRKAEAYLADCYQDVHKFNLAIKHYKRAKKINDNYPSWVDEGILDCKEKLNNKKIQFDAYEIFSLEYKASEYLANFEPMKAKAITHNKRKQEFKLIEINILGFQNKTEEYIKSWINYFELGNTVYLTTSNWYYMPNSVFNDKRIWKIFLKYYRLIVNSCFIQFDSLSEYGFKNKRLKIQKIICQYKVYKLEKNLKGLKALHKKFPKWAEVKKELEKLGNKQAN